MTQSLPPWLVEQSASGPPALADALAIWWAGVVATRPAELFAREARVVGNALEFSDWQFELKGIKRIVVVGAGKASGSMATALYQTCLKQLEPRIEIMGWINAPAGSFEPASAGKIVLHAARPAGINEPTAEAVAGTNRIRALVESCGPSDLCIVLLSGGGSAILTSPIDGITLSDKQQVARHVAAAGANIAQLNTVRRALSRVKGGGLARACRAREMITLVISDVLGDPLETIASGTTLQSAAALPSEALEVLKQLGLLTSEPLANVVRTLTQLVRQESSVKQLNSQAVPVTHIILANNASAVDAAGVKAVELGYRYIMQAARTLEGDVDQLAVKAADTLEQLGHQPEIDCWISGGEPTVKLPPATECGRGGRNQQLMLLTMLELTRRGWPLDHQRFPVPLLCLSAGTDGEDGPTRAAGAWFDDHTFSALRSSGLDAQSFARRADAYTLFEKLNGLILSGGTGTNVCDLRIALKM